MSRFYKEWRPDGFDADGPYWIMPNDRKTHDFQEWLEADKKYWKEKERN